MKKIILVTVLASASAFAGKTDLALFNATVNSGVTAEAGMSQLRFVVDNVKCVKTNMTGNVMCSLSQDGKNINISGNNAKIIFSIVSSVNGGDGAAGHTYTDASSIYCSQVAKGVSGGANQSSAARTSCEIK